VLRPPLGAYPKRTSGFLDRAVGLLLQGYLAQVAGVKFGTNAAVTLILNWGASIAEEAAWRLIHLPSSGLSSKTPAILCCWRKVATTVKIRSKDRVSATLCARDNFRRFEEQS
jgi:hypothetical protein